MVGDGAALLRRIRLEMDSAAGSSAEDQSKMMMQEQQQEDTVDGDGGDMSIAAAAREIRAGGGLSLLCVDADSKDAGLGMSAPPPEFTSDRALDDMYVPPPSTPSTALNHSTAWVRLAVLREGGVLCINIVARSAQVRQAFLDRLQARVGERPGSRLLTGRAGEDTVNVVAVVIKGGDTEQPLEAGGLEGLLRTWRQVR